MPLKSVSQSVKLFFKYSKAFIFCNNADFDLLKTFSYNILLNKNEAF